MNKKNEVFAEIIRNRVDRESTPGAVTRMSKVGHFSVRCFHGGNYPNMKFRTWLHVMMNIALELTREKYIELWKELGAFMYEMAENHAQELNEKHARKRKKKKTVM